MIGSCPHVVRDKATHHRTATHVSQGSICVISRSANTSSAMRYPNEARDCMQPDKSSHHETASATLCSLRQDSAFLSFCEIGTVKVMMYCPPGAYANLSGLQH